MEKILSIIMLVISFLGVGTPDIYTVVSTPNAHIVIVCDKQGNEYTYYQEIVTVDEGDKVVDCEGQLMRCEENTKVEVPKGSYMLKSLKHEMAIYTHDLIVYIPYCLGDM